MAGGIVDPSEGFEKSRDRRPTQLILVVFVLITAALVEWVAHHPLEVSRLFQTRAEREARQKAEAEAKLRAQEQAAAERRAQEEAQEAAKLRAQAEAEAKKKADAQAGYNRADMLFTAAQYDKCCDEFEQAIKIYPSAPCLTHIRYICACAYLRRGAAAGASAAHFLNTFGWTKADGQLDWSAYAVLYGYTGYRQAGNASAAKQLIDAGAVKCNTTRWPYPLLACLHGEMDTSALFSLAGNDQWKATDARTFVGIQQLYDGDERKAMADFAWVVENGRKDFLDFALAMSELRRLTKFKNPPSQTEQAQNAMPSEADKAAAQAGFNRTEMFWKASEYDKVCDEFEQAFSLYPVPPYSALCDYIVACTYVRRGEAAGRFAELSLAAFGWQRPLSAYHVLYGYTGYRQAGDKGDAQQLLDDAAMKCNPDVWPYALIASLRGEIGTSTLFSRIGNNAVWITEARTFVGIKQQYDGDGIAAAENFAWVRESGNKSDLAYGLASSEIRYAPPPSVPSMGQGPPPQPIQPITVQPQPQVNNDPIKRILERATRGEQLQVTEVETLATARLSDGFIIDKMRQSHSVYRLTSDEIIELKQAGVSENVIDFMINSPNLSSPRSPGH
jgi:lipoprotein NlpI